MHPYFKTEKWKLRMSKGPLEATWQNVSRARTHISAHARLDRTARQIAFSTSPATWLLSCDPRPCPCAHPPLPHARGPGDFCSANAPALLLRVSPSPHGTSFPLPAALWTSPPAPWNVPGLLATLVPTAGADFPPDDRAEHEVSAEAEGVDSSSPVTDRRSSRSGSALDFITVSSREGRVHGKCARHVSQTENKQVGAAPQASKTP